MDTFMNSMSALSIETFVLQEMTKSLDNLSCKSIQVFFRGLSKYVPKIVMILLFKHCITHSDGIVGFFRNLLWEVFKKLFYKKYTLDISKTDTLTYHLAREIKKIKSGKVLYHSIGKRKKRI